MRNIFWLAIVLAPTPCLAQRDLTKIPDPDPEVERRSFQVAPGFEVNLFAADPLLAKPIQMNFDAKGRLWVASSEVYPQIKPGQAATDKILVLEDKDGDGKADSTTVFADGLLIPTGVEPGDGGAYIANSTELLHLKDTDGDGKADARRVMLSGFGTEDTHHILHTFRWGEDGMLYMNQSIYIHSHLETPWGPRRLNGGGIWQFRPETMGLEVFARGWVNSWGHHQDAFGASFATDGAGGEGINFIVPGAYYTAAPDAVRILPGLNPGSPKYCGLEVVSGRHLPDDWQGNLITNDFRANRVCRFVVSDDGSASSSREQPELIKTTHGAFRPIDVKMGPDGAIYIADWYNPIIQHGEVDFRDPRRDHTRGRIWRVTAKGRPLVDRPKLSGAPIADLLEGLKSPEGYTRHFAKRVMKERGANEVVPALAARVEALDPKSANFERDRLEAMWMYQSVDVAEPELLAGCLNSADFRVRAAACRVVPHWKDRISDAVALLAPRVEDEHPRVRLEAVRALGRVPDDRSVPVALRALDRPMDKWLDYAVWLTAREGQSRWLPALQAGRLDLGDARKIAFALSAAGSPAVVGPLLESLRAGKVEPGSTIRLVATLGGPGELGGALDLVLTDEALAPRRAELLDALAAATRSRKVRPDGDLWRLGGMLESNDDALRIAAARAVGAWKVEGLRSKLPVGEAPDAVARASFEALADLGGEEARKVLGLLATAGPRPSRRADAAVALAAIDPKGAAEAALLLLRAEAKDRLSADESAALVAGLTGRKDASEALAEAVGKGDLPADAAKLAIRGARASGRDESSLIAAFSKAGKLGTAAPPPTEAEMKALLAEVASSGDPARGEAVFRRKDMQCLNCHAIAGAGGQVGPGLESIGASAQADYLVDSLLQPGKAVKEGYHAVTVATDDGRVLTGVRLRDNDKGLLIRDADGREVEVSAESIEEKKDAGSLMPLGLTDALTRGEFVDLVRFLTELGKVGPYSVGKDRVVRRWQVSGGTDRVGGPGLDGKTVPAPPPEPAYSRVDGVLPLEAIPAARLSGAIAEPSAPGRAAFEVDVTTPGLVRLRLNSITGTPAISVDGDWVESKEVLDLDLRTGRHTILLNVNCALRKEGIRCVVEDVPGSPAKAQPVLGR